MRNETTRKLLLWEIAGFLFIVGGGSALHFIHEWTGEATWAAVLGAVNESTWEHLKLPFWPALILLIVEITLFPRLAFRLVASRLVGVLSMLLLIVSGAWLIEQLPGGHRLVLDIGLFVLAVGVGQVIGWKIGGMMVAGSVKIGVLAVLGWLLLGVAFGGFTFFPPEIGLFRDPVTGGYGLPAVR